MGTIAPARPARDLYTARQRSGPRARSHGEVAEWLKALAC
jgi:hypothetical protein